MITRNELRELARFQSRKDDDCLSFYFQPQPHRTKAHREGLIQVKDLLRRALPESNGHGLHRASLERIGEKLEDSASGPARARAVFVCERRKFWKEYDLPPCLAASQLDIDRRFHLKPLAMVLGTQPWVCVALVDRKRARLFDLRLNQLTEREDLFHPLPKRGRSDGFAGYDAGHAERRVSDEALHHFKYVAHRLHEQQEKGVWESLIVGCQEENWPALEAQLHPSLKQRTLGRFPAEVGSTDIDAIRTRAAKILHDSNQRRCHELVEKVMDHAGKRLGATGSRGVLSALERGEVQTLLLAENFTGRLVECTSCGHLDSHLIRFCPVCGHTTREPQDAGDALVSAALRYGTDTCFVRDDERLDRCGGIAAMLRFRAEHGVRRLARRASA